MANKHCIEGDLALAFRKVAIQNPGLLAGQNREYLKIALGFRTTGELARWMNTLPKKAKKVEDD